ETYIGGKARNMHKSRKARALGGKGARGFVGKTAVQGILQRSGKIRTKVVEDISRKALVDGIREHVDAGSTLYTDEAVAYFGIEGFDHHVINHLEAYAVGNVHTNGLENFWSLLKRGLNGTYVSVEPFHLFRYVDEQVFRYNNRATKANPMTDADRFSLALSQIAGKRLTYKEVTGKVGETPF